MPTDPSITAQFRHRPVLTRRRWQALPVVHSNHAALVCGLRPGEYRRRGDSYERDLASLGVEEPPDDPRLVVEDVDGITLRLQIERTSTRSPVVTPAALRAAVERLIEAALDGAARPASECGCGGHR